MNEDLKHLHLSENTCTDLKGRCNNKLSQMEIVELI